MHQLPAGVQYGKGVESDVNIQIWSFIKTDQINWIQKGMGIFSEAYYLAKSSAHKKI